MEEHANALRAAFAEVELPPDFQVVVGGAAACPILAGDLGVQYVDHDLPKAVRELQYARELDQPLPPRYGRALWRQFDLGGESNEEVEAARPRRACSCSRREPRPRSRGRRRATRPRSTRASRTTAARADRQGRRQLPAQRDRDELEHHRPDRSRRPGRSAGPGGPAGAARSERRGRRRRRLQIGTIAITGAKPGQFAGAPYSVVGFSHEIISPRDPASGLPTGKRQHKPFNVVTLGRTGGSRC